MSSTHQNTKGGIPSDTEQARTVNYIENAILQCADELSQSFITFCYKSPADGCEHATVSTGNYWYYHTGDFDFASAIREFAVRHRFTLVVKSNNYILSLWKRTSTLFFDTIDGGKTKLNIKVKQILPVNMSTDKNTQGSSHAFNGTPREAVAESDTPSTKLGDRLRRMSVGSQMKQRLEVVKFMETTIETYIDKLARHTSISFTYTTHPNDTFSIVSFESTKYTGIGHIVFGDIVREFADNHNFTMTVESHGVYNLMW